MTRAIRVAFGLVLLSSAAAAQRYVISTIAGGAPPATPIRGLDMPLNVTGVATDAAGNVYFNSTLDCVFKLDPNGFLTLVAGNSRPGYSGDGGPGARAQLNSPRSMAVDKAGNLFIADTDNHRVRRVSPSGIIVTVAGNGSAGFSGDAGPAASAQLNSPRGLAVDSAGNLFIADVDNHRVRRVPPDGIITTVAGNGSVGFSGDAGPAKSSPLFPDGVAVDSAGNLFIVDSNSRVRKVSPDGIITTVAGNGTKGFSGDGGLATSAQLSHAVGVAVDGTGNLFIAESGHIRKVSPDGVITSVWPGHADYRFNPTGVAVDGAGNLFVADNWNRIFKVSPEGSIATVAGNLTWAFSNLPYVLSGVSGDGGPATRAQLVWPTGVAVDGAGNLLIADPGRIRKVSTAGIIATVAGDGRPSFSGDGGPATSAHVGGPSFGGPFSVAVDDAGNVFVADTFVYFDGSSSGNRVRKISPTGIITTVAGNGTYGFSGDGGPASSAQLSGPAGLVADGAGNLFIGDSDNNRIRRVSPDGIITTVAGNGTFGGSSGDGGPATSAQVSRPLGVAVDRGGNLFIGSSFGGWEGGFGSGLIRKVSASGIVTTVAGTGKWGFSGDGGPATSAELTVPIGMAVDGAGNLFFADVENSRIRKVSPDGIITTVAGNGIPGFSGDGGFATSAQLNHPEGVAVDGAGNLYIADTENHAIRVLRPTNRSVLISAVVDAASQSANPISPGKIVVIYGAGLGPARLVRNQPGNGQFGTAVDGTVVSFNGIAAPVLYASATQVAAVVPYALGGTMAQVVVAYQGLESDSFAVPVVLSAPSLFTLNQTGAGQAAAINAADGTLNTAANPVKAGGYISLFATGAGQTSPGGVDGRLGGATPTLPVLPVSVTVGGILATVQYVGAAPGQVAGLMQLNVQIPNGVQPGGYVPVVLQVGDASTTAGAVWIAVAN